MSKPPKWYAERVVDDSGFETGKLHIIMRGAPCAYDFDLPEDAQLASAAPDMLDVLERLFERGDVNVMLAGNPTAIRSLEADARAAIARARGETA